MRFNELWFHVLNAELDAKSRAELDGHLRLVFGPALVSLSDDFFVRQRGLLKAVREQLQALQGGGATAVSLPAVVAEAHAPLSWAQLWSLLAGPAPGGNGFTPQADKIAVEALVLGFAAHVHDCRHDSQPQIVERCVALAPAAAEVDPWGYGELFAFLADRDHVREQLGHEAEISYARCPKLFRRIGRGGFCSKSCRDRSFALARRQRDPRYDAEKQRRYRERLKGRQGPELSL